MLLMLAACATAQRPAGIVERWLLSLNQGSAGRPGVYAPTEVSDQVLPGWRRLDPGQLDEIEVGKSVPVQDGSIGPFRIITIDGDEDRNISIVWDGRITGLTTSDVIAIRLPPGRRSRDRVGPGHGLADRPRDRRDPDPPHMDADGVGSADPEPDR